MKKTIALIGVLASMTSGANAELTLDANAGYASEYIFRGQDYGNSLLYGGFDATYSGLFGLRKLSGRAGTWAGNFETRPAGGVNFDSEFDFYGALGYDLGFAQAEAGYTYYLFPDAGSLDSQELFFSFSKYCEECQMNFALTYFLDLEDQDNGGYLQATVSKSYTLSERLSLDIELLGAYLVEEGDFSHLGATISFPFVITDVLTLTPYVSGTLELDGLSTVSPTNAQNELIGGITLSAGF